MRRRQLLGLVALGLAGALPAAAAEKGEDKKKSGGTSYIPVPMLTAYTVKPGGRRGVMTVDCGLDIPDGKLRDRTQLFLPRLRAAFVQSLQIYAGGLPDGRPPDPDFLATTFQRSTDQMLGKAGARVLLGAIIIN